MQYDFRTSRTRCRPELRHAEKGLTAAWEDPLVKAFGLRWREWARRPEWTRTSEWFVSWVCSAWALPRRAWLKDVGLKLERAFADWTASERAHVSPPGVQCPKTKEEAEGDWALAAGILGDVVPNEFWSMCENMWIAQNLKYRGILREYNLAWGLSERKSLKKHVSYWGGCEAPKVGNALVRLDMPGVRGSDVTNDVYAAVFKQLWPTSHTASCTK